MEVIRDQKKENQCLCDGLALKGIWTNLLDGFATTSAFTNEYSNALTWLSSVCASQTSNANASSSSQQGIVLQDKELAVEFLERLIPEIRRSQILAGEQYNSVIHENYNLRELLGTKSAALMMVIPILLCIGVFIQLHGLIYLYLWTHRSLMRRNSWRLSWKEIQWL